MPPRFHAPDAARSGDLLLLSHEEGDHLVRVLRLGSGAQVRVFNGRGDEFDAVVRKAGKSEVQVEVGARRAPAAPEPGIAITLAQAVLKGEKMDAIVRDAVMLGVAGILPIVTARSEVTRATLQRGRRADRWRRVAVASAKQCGRAVVPEIHEPRTFDEAGAAIQSFAPAGARLMLVEPSVADGAVALRDLERSRPRAVALLVGPEGGWTEHEVETGSAACRLVTLGGRTIRADAMPTVALAALFAIWKEF